MTRNFFNSVEYSSPEDSISLFEQRSRRYLGNKFKLINFIRRIINSKCSNICSFADVFSGTGVVASAFNMPNTSVIANDLLYSNYICLRTFLGSEVENRDRVRAKIHYLNHLEANCSNYFSENFGGRYFSEDNARKIGVIRDEIDNIAEEDNEKILLLCSLLYAVDKVANTVGHYDAFRQQIDAISPIKLRYPNIVSSNNNLNNQIYCEDANSLVKQIDCDVLYLDPPYNSRQYSDAYHLLENLVSWDKPPVSGTARKMDRSHIKSKYCLQSATEAFAELIENASCRHIFMSYNNTGNSMNVRSNARISDYDIREILSSRGEVEVFSHEHKAFTTGKGSGLPKSERLFYCRVA